MHSTRQCWLALCWKAPSWPPYVQTDSKMTNAYCWAQLGQVGCLWPPLLRNSVFKCVEIWVRSTVFMMSLSRCHFLKQCMILVWRFSSIIKVSFTVVDTSTSPLYSSFKPDKPSNIFDHIENLWLLEHDECQIGVFRGYHWPQALKHILHSNNFAHSTFSTKRASSTLLQLRGISVRKRDNFG